MAKEINSPFTPGLPVTPEFFVGRLAEVERLRKKVASAARGRLEVGFLIGERGIGKTSLASIARLVSERESQMIGIHIFLGGVSTLEEMVRRVFDRLVKDSIDKPWHEKVQRFFGQRIRKVDLFGFGVEFATPPEDLGRLVRDFVPVLDHLVDQLKEERKGIFLVMDDINGLASSAEFANWLKSTIDEIAISPKRLPLCILMVGIEERRQSLIGVQPSLARAFDLIEIRAWSDEEVRAFYKQAFGSVGIEVEEPALGLLCSHSGGLPVLAHEVGDAAFWQDRDGHIDEIDASRAVLTAADIIGRKYLEPQVLQAIQSKRYHSILRKLAAEPFEIEFQRSEVLKLLAPDETTVLDNFLRRMAELGVVQRDPERGRGAYSFTNRLHYTYFWMEAQRAKEGRKAKTAAR